MTLSQVSVCACNACKSMCKSSPCFGTPQDIQLLIDAGYSEALMVTAWIDIQWDGLWPVIAPIATPNGCAFLTPDGLCKLHELLLKPLEGRLAHHTITDTAKLRRSICYTWVNQLGFDLLFHFNADPKLLNRLTELRLAYKR